jgi:SAM-dependent methyltransferase
MPRRARRDSRAARLVRRWFEVDDHRRILRKGAQHMNRSSATPHDAERLRAVNRDFYDALWCDTRLVLPQRFNTWPLVRALSANGGRRLEVAPGLRPRLPLRGGVCLDLSPAAALRLSAHGATVVRGCAAALPFADGAFDLICACDIFEHLDDDRVALAELARVAAPGARLLLSVPLHPERWNAFDDFVGHCRRYETPCLLALLESYGFTVERSAAYGMQPRSSRLLKLGLWFLIHQRRRALWWYNRVMMPLALRWQKALVFRDGMIDTQGVDEVLLLCRKGSGTEHRLVSEACDGR